MSVQAARNRYEGYLVGVGWGVEAVWIKDATEIRFGYGVFRARHASGLASTTFADGGDGRVTDKGGWVYIVTNRANGILYIGVTFDLIRRVGQHRAGEVEGFTKRYGLTLLVYFEQHDDILSAIAREKAMKAWKRAWKVRLIMKGNPGWDDLYPGIL